MDGGSRVSLEAERDRLQRNLDTAQAALCAAADALSNGDAEEAHKFLSRQKAYENALAWRRDLEARAERAEELYKRVKELEQYLATAERCHEVAEARVAELEAWRDKVTVASSFGGGRHFDDVATVVSRWRDHMKCIGCGGDEGEVCCSYCMGCIQEADRAMEAQDGTGAIG